MLLCSKQAYVFTLVIQFFKLQSRDNAFNKKEIKYKQPFPDKTKLGFPLESIHYIGTQQVWSNQSPPAPPLLQYNITNWKKNNRGLTILNTNNVVQIGDHYVHLQPFLV